MVACHVGMFVIFSVFIFSFNLGNLAFGGDGGYYFLHARQQWEWAPFALGLTANPFQGLGDVWFAFNSKLFPAFLIPALLTHGEPQINSVYIVSTYVICATELFLGAVVLARSLRIGLIGAVTAGWALPLLTEPYFGLPLLYPMLTFVPGFATSIAEFCLLAAAANELGRGPMEAYRSGWRRSLLFGIGILMLLVVMIAAVPTQVVLWAPSGLATVIALLLGAAPRERVVKLVGLSVVLVFLLASGPAAFVYGLFDFTMERVDPSALENTPVSLVFASFWSSNNAPAGAAVFVVGVVGMLAAMMFGERRLRWLAACQLGCAAAIVGFGFAVNSWGVFWRGPETIYFEFFVLPFYIVFALWAIGWAHRHLRRRFRAARFDYVTRWAALLALIVVVPAIGTVCASSFAHPTRSYQLPPSKPPIVAALERAIGLAPDTPFRGAVATMDLVARPDAIGWFDVIAVDAPRYLATGNEYHWNGLWYHDIPTVFEYSPTISPAYFRAVTRLFARPDDRQMKNVLVLRQPDAHALGIFGVRFVISDAALPEPFRFVMSDKTAGDETLSLYEVPEVNLGVWSPTQVAVAESFDNALAAIATPDFDGSRSAVLFDRLPGDAPLVAAQSVELRVVPRGYAVTATSPGRSLVVLPFQFSRCLEASSHDGAPPPQLVRVNALQIGVLFEHRVAATIEYFTGMFSHSTCRIQDAADFAALLNRR